LIDVDTANLFDGFLYGRHFILPKRFQGPQRTVSVMVGSGPALVSLREAA
jgi:hypothetical protein